MKKKKLIFRILLILAINMSASTGMHVIASIVKGSHGAPSFVTPSFVLYGTCSSLLMILAYILMGYRIPTKSRMMRGVIYILLFWSSDYLSQLLGTLGAESSILSGDAFSMTTILFDTIAYFITGVFLGLLLDLKKDLSTRKCTAKRLIQSCIISAIVFAGVAFGLEMLIGMINHDMLGYVAFGIREDEKISYYVVFYLCQAFSGLLFPIFYRLTEYNSAHAKKWLYFSSVYGLMLWLPIVLIVIFFGTPVLPTIVFAIILVAAIYVDSAVFTYILEK